MAEVKRLTLADIKAEGIGYQRILSVEIVEEACRHGLCRLTVETGKLLKGAELSEMGSKKVTLKNSDKGIIFCGVPQRIWQETTKGNRTLYLELITLSAQVDRKPRSRTFQDSNKTLKQVLAQVAKDCGVGSAEIAAGKAGSEKIALMLYQDKETDWQFVRHLAASRGTFVFADAKTDKLKIGVGVVPFKVSKEPAVIKERGCRVLLALAESVKQNINDKAVKTSFTETEVLTNELTVGVGYEVKYGGKKLIVKKSHIVTEGSTLVNYLCLIPPEGCCVTANLALEGTYEGKYLTGKVLEAKGKGGDKDTDCLKVQFDCDKSQDKGKALWIPYMNIVSNYMYAMPDEGERVSVYFEENGKLWAIGSLRNEAAQKRLSELKPNIKSFSSEDQVLEFKSDEVYLAAGQKAKNVWLKQTNDAGISLKAKSDVLINGDGDVVLQASQGQTMSGQAQLLTAHAVGYGVYTATTGKPPSTMINTTVGMVGKSASSLKSDGKAKDKVTLSELAKALDKKTGSKAAEEQKSGGGSGGGGGQLTVKAGKTLLLKVGDSSIEVSSGKIKTRVLYTAGYIPAGAPGDGSPAAIGPGSVNNRADSIKTEHGTKDRKRMGKGGAGTNDSKRISRAG